ncbi:alpha/beta fold hydrolase [Noviluteimonas dokdonensis]|nr:alpha/beta hydrolase [Lysobacter dokdonensis]
MALAIASTAMAQEAKVDRPGYSLQVARQGDAPVAIVFESGFGQGAGVWQGVVDELGATCGCVAYSRAGLGKSGTDGKPKTIEAHLQDLGAVIDAQAKGRKVVLVGHSYGGLLVTEYARLHPERVQGLVLVDPATMGQRVAFKQADAARVAADDKALLSMLPPKLAEDYTLLVTQLDEPANATPHAQPDVPVALLTSTQVVTEPFVFEETAAGKALWKQQHAQLFATYARGEHLYFRTGHNIHREDPKAVADAIRVILADAKSTED